MTENNRENIRALFSAHTGVDLPRRTGRRAQRTALILAALIALLSVGAAAAREFSALDGDDLALSSEYLGGGVLRITVENRSDVALRLAGGAKLTRWATGELLAGPERLTFPAGSVPSGEARSFTVDLNGVCDAAALEEPIEDWYVLTLTDRGFLFGHDWQCSVRFSPPPAVEPDPSAPPGGEPAAGRAPELAFYFEASPEWASAEERALEARYAAAVDTFLAGSAVAAPVSPISSDLVLFDRETPIAEQAVRWDYAETGRDATHKYIGRPGDTFWCIYGLVPDAVYPESYARIPLLYLAMFEQAPARGVFLCGRLVGSAELESVRLPTEGRFVLYDISDFVCADARAAMAEAAARDPHALFTPEVEARLWEERGELRSALPRLILPREEYLALASE